MTDFTEVVLDLFWAQWRELGVPGVVRGLEWAAIDPEWLIVHTPVVSRLDPRLDELAFAWCAAQHTWVSTRRLRSIADAADDAVAEAFRAWAADLAPHLRHAWSDQSPADPPRPVVRELRPDFERPSMVVLRARALMGVGARADVLCRLVEHGGAWVSASDVADGYTRRSASSVLADFERAGMLATQGNGRARRYQLADRGPVDALVGASGVRWLHWPSVFGFTAAMMELGRLPGASSTRVVTVQRIRDRVADFAARLGWPSPPGSREPGPLQDWAAQCVRYLTRWQRLGRIQSLVAKGMESAFRGHGTFNAPVELGSGQLDAVVQLLWPHKDLVVEVKSGSRSPADLRLAIQSALDAGRIWHEKTQRPARAVLVLTILDESDRASIEGQLARLQAELPGLTVPLDLAIEVLLVEDLERNATRAVTSLETFRDALGMADTST